MKKINKENNYQPEKCEICNAVAKFLPPTEIVKRDGRKYLKVTFVCPKDHVTVKYIELKTN